MKLIFLDKGHLDIQGNGDMKGKVDLSLTGVIPMQTISAFSNDLQNLKGNARLSASLRGMASDPEIRAKIHLEKIGLSLPFLNQQLHDLNGQIEISPEEATLKDIKGKLDDGDFSLAGKVALANFQPTHGVITIDANKIPLNVPDTLDLLLDAHIQISGKEEKSLIEGKIDIIEGLYYKDLTLSLLKDVTKKDRPETPPQEEISHPLLKNLEWDVELTRKGEVLVDNNVALMALTPQLRIYGSAGNPLLSGRTSVDSGVLTFHQKEFVIKKGIIDFLNPYKIEPTVQLQSETEVRDWTIFLDISGAPENLKFKLTSKPAEEPEDILALLAFGKTAKELIGGDKGSSNSPEEILAGFISKRVSKNVKTATGLDIAEVKLNNKDGKSGADDVSVTLGKELSKRISIIYSTETKDSVMVQRVASDYKFFENLLLSAFRDTNGDYGSELKFRLEFR
jgi:translocation and assembly module TamB